MQLSATEIDGRPRDNPSTAEKITGDKRTGVEAAA